MADVTVSDTSVVTAITATNRYILAIPRFNTGKVADQVVIQIDLNGGTCSYAFQARSQSGLLGWVSCLAYPVSSTTPATSGTASDVWHVDATGKDIALNVTANTGAPRIAVLAPLG